MLFKADMRPSEERMPAVILKKWMINAKIANGSKQQRGMWGGVSRNAEKNSGAVFDVKPTAQDIRGATCYFFMGAGEVILSALNDSVNRSDRVVDETVPEVHPGKSP